MRNQISNADLGEMAGPYANNRQQMNRLLASYLDRDEELEQSNYLPDYEDTEDFGIDKRKRSMFRERDGKWNEWGMRELCGRYPLTLNNFQPGSVIYQRTHYDPIWPRSSFGKSTGSAISSGRRSRRRLCEDSGKHTSSRRMKLSMIYSMRITIPILR